MAELDTEERRRIHEFIESGDKTTAMVFDEFGEHGLSRLGKLLLDGSYSIDGAPHPYKNERPTQPHSVDKGGNRILRRHYAFRILHSKAANTVINIHRRFSARSD